MCQWLSIGPQMVVAWVTEQARRQCFLASTCTGLGLFLKWRQSEVWDGVAPPVETEEGRSSDSNGVESLEKEEESAGWGTHNCWAWHKPSFVFVCFVFEAKDLTWDFLCANKYSVTELHTQPLFMIFQYCFGR